MPPRTLLNSRLPMRSTLVLPKVTLANRVLGENSYFSGFAYFVLFTSTCFSRNAMGNASKNTSDMISNLQMKYNRARKAAITNELVDIITGMLLRSLFGFLFI
jgi:hypothetical protein